MSKELILNGKCLYTPDGAAREYAAVGCNFYRGCPYQCRYCYNKRGMTAKVMGLNYAVLKDCFTEPKKRPKKYITLSGEEYAFVIFKQELEKHIEYFRKTGIFFSFSTDPLCPDAFYLTMRCAGYAVSNYEIPVKILTKNADLSSQQLTLMDYIPLRCRKMMAFGFTLTGHDDWEPFASNNMNRVRMMEILHNMGFHTFASIEPVVDFDSSLQMIEKTVMFCEQYLIGLMSSRKANGLEPYNKEESLDFIENTTELLYGQGSAAVYWKESVRKLMGDSTVAMELINNSPVSVTCNWSLFERKELAATWEQNTD